LTRSKHHQGLKESNYISQWHYHDLRHWSRDVKKTANTRDSDSKEEDALESNV
jgi:hypothetical protein